MIFGSICSGIEAASVAWHPLGWKAAWFAEIEPFCCEVLKQRWADVPNYGDFTKIETAPAIDLLVGGTPCQSFSVAGKRAGLDDPRGNLTLEFFALAGRLRPRWLVWENVPGVMSNDSGRTFGTVLGLLGQLGYGFAYRVLDAQHFGVPQRRRRVFVVGYLGDWRPPAAVLFERGCLSGDPPPSREAGESIAGTIAAGAHPSGFNGRDAERGNIIAHPILAKSNCSFDETIDNYVTHSLRADGFDASEDGTGCGTPLCIQSVNTVRDKKQNGIGISEHSALAVRRLTPREAERLQGFPDDYSLIAYRGKPAADGPRYRALGNSMAVPVMRWIGERITQFGESK